MALNEQKTSLYLVDDHTALLRLSATNGTVLHQVEGIRDAGGVFALIWSVTAITPPAPSSSHALLSAAAPSSVLWLGLVGEGSDDMDYTPYLLMVDAQHLTPLRNLSHLSPPISSPCLFSIAAVHSRQRVMAACGSQVYQFNSTGDQVSYWELLNIGFQAMAIGSSSR